MNLEIGALHQGRNQAKNEKNLFYKALNAKFLAVHKAVISNQLRTRQNHNDLQALINQLNKKIPKISLETIHGLGILTKWVKAVSKHCKKTEQFTENWSDEKDLLVEGLAELSSKSLNLEALIYQIQEYWKEKFKNLKKKV